MLSSATNFMLGAFVARAVTPRDFGAFSVVYATFTLSLGASRAVAGEPLVVRSSSVSTEEWREAVRLSVGTSLMVGLIVGLGCILGALLAGGPFRIVLAILGVFLPVLLVQDTWRYALFAHGRGGAAFFNDLTWAVAMFVALGLLMHAELANVAWFTAAWASGGTIAAIVGLLQVKVAPSGPLGAFKWLSRNRDLASRFLAEFALSSGASSLIVFGIGSLSGLAQVGQLRAGQIALGPLNVMFAGAAMATVPEGVRLLKESPQRLARASRLISLVTAAVAFSWGVLVLVVPNAIGRFTLGANWEGARSLVVPLSIGVIGYGLSFGATTGLRSLAAAKRSLRARELDALSSILFVLSGASLGGASGAAWGYALAGCLRVANSWWHFTKALGEHRESMKSPSLEQAPATDSEN
jgi:O-antigen/teichoic acid export membrane protein